MLGTIAAWLTGTPHLSTKDLIYQYRIYDMQRNPVWFLDKELYPREVSLPRVR